MLPVGPPMPDRSRVMTQTKRGTLVLQAGSLAWGYQHHTVKNLLLRKLSKGISWINVMMLDGKGLGIHFDNYKESSSS
jgi:hypothetical protein